jgi:orotidine-5'-phosphate decarboxylase
LNKIPLDERIIFALDFADPEEAKKWVKKTDKKIKFFKVGLQLFLAGWWPVIDFIVERGNKVMVDLKFFDIPETVKLAVQQLQDRHITFTTIHGNNPVIEAAVQEKADIKLLAVTVLTSFDESDMIEMGFSKKIEDLVLIRAKKAMKLGCDGVVASPLEVAGIRQETGDNTGFLIVTPGIRPGLNRDIEHDDQKRIATAREAIINGADHVVIGRPISTSHDPLGTISQIQQEIEEGCMEREKMKNITH